jgi:hypothetical protein
MKHYNTATTKATVAAKLKVAASTLPAAVNVGITLFAVVGLLSLNIAFSLAQSSDDCLWSL